MAKEFTIRLVPGFWKIGPLVVEVTAKRELKLREVPADWPIHKVADALLAGLEEAGELPDGGE